MHFRFRKAKEHFHIDIIYSPFYFIRSSVLLVTPGITWAGDTELDVIEVTQARLWSMVIRILWKRDFEGDLQIKFRYIFLVTGSHHINWRLTQPPVLLWRSVQVTIPPWTLYEHYCHWYWWYYIGTGPRLSSTEDRWVKKSDIINRILHCKIILWSFWCLSWLFL